MVCTDCHMHLHTERSGFVVCPHCGTVNISTVSQPAHVHHVHGHAVAAQGSRRRRYRHLLPHLQLFTPVFVCAVIALLVLGVGGRLLYSNAQAGDLLASARTAITKGEYQAALVQLDAAVNLRSFDKRHQQIINLYNDDKTWVNDNQKLLAATRLTRENKYTDAASALKEIHPTFPDYKTVLALQTTIDARIAAAKAAVTAQTTTPTTAPVTRPKTTAPKPAATVTVRGKRFTSTAASTSLAAATTITQAEQALQTFASQYGLTMGITSVSPSSYVTSYDTFDILSSGSDLTWLKTYGALFIDEWAKYPTDWVTHSKLKYIMLVKNFAVSGTHRAAGPDPFGQAMYYDVSYGGDYAREVIHHEYDHLFTYNYFTSYSPADPTWQSLNPPGFSYGTGGAACYLPNNTCLSGEHPIGGFVTGYGASGIEEDKAELFAYLMTGTYYHHLQSWLPTDMYLTNKVNNYKQFISSHSPTMSGSYFSDIDP